MGDGKGVLGWLLVGSVDGRRRKVGFCLEMVAQIVAGRGDGVCDRPGRERRGDVPSVEEMPRVLEHEQIRFRGRKRAMRMR